MPSVVLVCKNSVSFQLTHPLKNLAKVKRGPLLVGNQHGRSLPKSGGQLPTSTPLAAALRSALRPPAVCWQIKAVSWTWRRKPCRVACGYVESLVLEAPVALSSVGREVVWVQVVVTRALWQTVVPVQKGFWLVHRFQVVIRLVGFRLEKAGQKKKK